MRRLLSVLPVLGLLLACSPTAPAPPAVTSTPKPADAAATTDARVAAILAGSPPPAASPIQVAASPSVAAASGSSAASNVTDKPLEIGPAQFLPFSAGAIAAAVPVKNPNADRYLPTSTYNATAYDAAGLVLGTMENVFSLGAGEERWIVIAPLVAAGTVVRVDFQVRAPKAMLPAANDPAPRLTILQSTPQLDLGQTRQVGAVRNDGAVAVKQVRVDTVYLDAQGKLLGVNFAFIQNLAPGQTGSFSTQPLAPPQIGPDTKTFVVAESLR